MVDRPNYGRVRRPRDRMRGWVDERQARERHQRAIAARGGVSIPIYTETTPRPVAGPVPVQLPPEVPQPPSPRDTTADLAARYHVPVARVRCGRSAVRVVSRRQERRRARRRRARRALALLANLALFAATAAVLTYIVLA